MEQTYGARLKAIREARGLIQEQLAKEAGLEPNCTLLGLHFVGPIVVAGVAGEEFTNLPEDGVKVFLDMFGRNQAGKDGQT